MPTLVGNLNTVRHRRHYGLYKDSDIAFVLASGNIKAWALIKSNQIKGNSAQLAVLGSVYEL